MSTLNMTTRSSAVSDENSGRQRKATAHAPPVGRRKVLGVISNVLDQSSMTAPIICDSKLGSLPSAHPPLPTARNASEQSVVEGIPTGDFAALGGTQGSRQPSSLDNPEQSIVGQSSVITWGARGIRTGERKRRDFSSVAPQRVTSARVDVPIVNEASYSAELDHLSLTSAHAPRPFRTREIAQANQGPKPLPPGVPDIDAPDLGNELACSIYVSDIYKHYREVEADTQTQPIYMQVQTDINDRMRAILIDWLVEVHLKFKLMPETLYLTVNLIDRFLAKEPVSRRNLQLVGVTAMLIAAKYEEIWAPEVRDFVYISDRAYTRHQILEMEKTMLNRLQFGLTVPTAHHFLARFLKAAAADRRTERLAAYLAELALPDYEMLNYSSSMISAAAVYTALKTLGHDACFPAALEHHAQYTESQIRPCAQLLTSLHRRAADTTLKAVFKKYDSPRFGEIARVPAFDFVH